MRAFDSRHRPLLFQLHLPFVHGERIGIEEIGAEQLLTIRLHANEPDFATGALTPPRRISAAPRAAPMAAPEQDRQKCDAVFRKDHAQTTIQSAMTIHPDIIALIHIALQCPASTQKPRLVLHPTPFRSQRTNRSREICAQRFLTIGEGARCHVFRGKSLLFRGKSLRRQKFGDDRKHDDDLAARLASKAVGRPGRHRPGALRTCHAARTPLVDVCS